MKALVLHSNGVLKLDERSRPNPTSGEPILVRVAYAGVCGSDIPRAFDGGAYHYPLVLGHEFSATVEEAPEGSAFGRGDRVTAFPLIPDLALPINRIGEYALSTGYDYYGSRRDGAFQEYLTLPERLLFRVPDSVSLLAAAMTEPCAVAYHAASRPSVAPGMSAAVIGGGPIGLMVAQWLRVRGCSPVIVSEIDATKRRLAEDLGLVAVDAAADPVAAVRDLTSGGADVVVEACGLPITFRQSIEMAGVFGQVVFLGNIHGTFSLEESVFSSLLRRELSIYGTWNSKVEPRGSDEWSRVLSALDTRVMVTPLVSHTPTIDRAADVLSAMHRREGSFNKVVVRVDDTLGTEGTP